ncbi:hypothetical protein [Chroococcidiopsis sp.]|uniref:hypothetical protein n=1 Tax=Chroococcidiopsis sp. TaxID=3088168 RepID=UPI003F2CCEF8
MTALRWTEEMLDTLAGAVYCVDHFYIHTKCDPIPPAGSSSKIIEGVQEGKYWKIKIGVPSHYACICFESLNAAIEYGLEKATMINSSADSDQAWRGIVDSIGD